MTLSSSKIPAEIRVFMVLRRSGATEDQIMLVLAKLNKEDKPKMFDDVQTLETDSRRWPCIKDQHCGWEIES